MCRPVPCETCGKITWSGCGDHVNQVRAMVRPEDWCPGHETVQRPGWPIATAPTQDLRRRTG